MIRKFAVLLVFSFILPSLALAQNAPTSPSTDASATPEMTRAAQALAGDWNNVETMEHSELFPNGGERRGTAHCGLTTGGSNLLCEGDSDGSAGKLSHLIVIWWDKDAK